MIQNKKTLYYVTLGCLVLSSLIIITAVQKKHQATLVRSTNKTHQKELTQVKKQSATIQNNQQDGLLKSSEAEAIGEAFFKDMFQQLHAHQSVDQSKYATHEVCEVANIMPVGNRSKTYPISLERQDIQYSTDLTGVSHGMGRIDYKDDGDERSYDVLLEIENGKITDLKLGHVTDTTGAKK